MRHGVLRGVAREARSAAGRSRRHAGTARDGTPDAGRDGTRCSRSSRRTPRTCRCPMRASTSRCRSTGRASGVIPARWIPEAARLLRPDGRLVFLTTARLRASASRGGRALRPRRFSARSEGCTRSPGRSRTVVEFHLGHGDWIDILRGAGFEIERLVELYAPDDAETHPFYDTATAEWARQWPSEDLWMARKTG